MQQGCEVWEFSSASDHDNVEAEEAALWQHILALVTLLCLCHTLGLSVCLLMGLTTPLHTTSSSQGDASTG